MNGDVARGRIVLQAIQNSPTCHVGQIDIQRNCAWFEFPRQRHGAAASQSSQGFQTMFVGQIHQDAGEGDIVLLAGKGHENYQEFADYTIPFDDIQIARRAIENHPVEFLSS